jgi:hypothetical protein
LVLGAVGEHRRARAGAVVAAAGEGLFGEAGGLVEARPGERPDGRAAGRAGFLGEQVTVGRSSAGLTARAVLSRVLTFTHVLSSRVLSSACAG